MNKLLYIAFIILPLCVNAQNTSSKLKKEQDKLEEKISDTKLLLERSETSKNASLNDLKVIQNQISYRERLLKNYDNQIRGAELTVQKKGQEIEQLKERMILLKSQYRELLIYAYKHRNKYGKMMYLFTSENYHEAKKRNRYLERIAEIQQKQFLVIQQNQELIQEEIVEVEKERAYKLLVIEEKKEERKKIEKDKEKHQELYEKFKAEEETLRAELEEKQRQNEVLKARISAAIQKEIAEAEAARKKREAERAEAARIAKEKANEGKEVAEVKPPEEPTFEETKEVEALSANFETNRGKLPWPVDKGTVTGKFGKNPHPTLKNVYTNNRGLDISSPKNAQVRAVFNGEVTSVLNIPGAGKVVIIKHGNYRTVYSNLQDTYVKSGTKVTTKKVIGSLLTKQGEASSVVHFEIHKVVGSSVTCLNPTIWIAQ